MAIDPAKFEQAKIRAEEAYKKIVKIRNPYLNDDVYFNSTGFNHILFKSWNVGRPIADQYMRLCLLPLAEKVIAKSHTLQEFYETKRFERIQSQSRWKQEMKLVKYYGFSAIINNALIKVIVKEIEGRNKIFYSLIPKWRDEIVNGQKKKALFKGSPEED